MSLPTIVHHTGLESSGGATRVARLLMDGLETQSVETSLTFELADKEDATSTPPNQFGNDLAEADIAHIHCTANWPELLTSIPKDRKVIITLHDCELFTGGCPYPLGCQAIDADCLNPCPRRFPDSEGLRKLKHNLIDQVNPTLVAPSRWLARLAKTHLFRPVTVIPNGIPWSKRAIRKDEARQQLGVSGTARVAVFAEIGRAACRERV